MQKALSGLARVAVTARHAIAAFDRSQGEGVPATGSIPVDSQTLDLGATEEEPAGVSAGPAVVSTDRPGRVLTLATRQLTPSESRMQAALNAVVRLSLASEKQAGAAPEAAAAEAADLVGPSLEHGPPPPSPETPPPPSEPLALAGCKRRRGDDDTAEQITMSIAAGHAPAASAFARVVGPTDSTAEIRRTPAASLPAMIVQPPPAVDDANRSNQLYSVGALAHSLLQAAAFAAAAPVLETESHPHQSVPLFTELEGTVADLVAKLALNRRQEQECEAAVVSVERQRDQLLQKKQILQETLAARSEDPDVPSAQRNFTEAEAALARAENAAQAIEALTRQLDDADSAGPPLQRALREMRIRAHIAVSEGATVADVAREALRSAQAAVDAWTSKREAASLELDGYLAVPSADLSALRKSVDVAARSLASAQDLAEKRLEAETQAHDAERVAQRYEQEEVIPARLRRAEAIRNTSSAEEALQCAMDENVRLTGLLTDAESAARSLIEGPALRARSTLAAQAQRISEALARTS